MVDTQSEELQPKLERHLVRDSESEAHEKKQREILLSFSFTVEATSKRSSIAKDIKKDSL